MGMRKIFPIVLLLFLCACGPLPSANLSSIHATGGSNTPLNSESLALRITVIDVGQGDSILVEAPTGESMLVDAGPAGAGTSAIIPLLASKNISELSYIVLTHNHEDHVGGLAEVLAGSDGITGAVRIQIKGDIYANFSEDSDMVNPRNSIHAGDRIELGDAYVEVVAADGTLADGETINLGEPVDENARSIVLLIEYSGFRMLLAADITGGGGDPPYQTPDIETSLAPIVDDIDILKIAHHGSNTSTNQEFLDATKPEVAIISVGDGNDFFHPHPSVIDRLIDAGITVYQTEKGSLSRDGPHVVQGNVVIEVDADGKYRLILDKVGA